MSLVVCCNAVLLHSDLPVNVESVETEQSTALTTPLAMTRSRDLVTHYTLRYAAFPIHTLFSTIYGATYF